MAGFKIENLSFSYPENPDIKVLSDINLSVKDGEYLIIAGKSGSGKTTLLRNLKTVLKPHGKTEGRILFSGKELSETDLKTQAEKIGFVMQDPDAQTVTDKVWHELAFGLESIGTDEKTMRIRVAEMAEYFGITDIFYEDVCNLSGGQKQLLNLASVMAMQPEVLILDEPTSQLDPIAASDFLNTIRKINSEIGTTVIMTEHRLEDVLYAADRAVIMDNGQIVIEATPTQLSEKISHENNEILSFMPSPVRIYSALEKDGDCPLTVKEGRAYLSSYFENKNPEFTRITDSDFANNNDNIIEIKDLYFRYEKTGKDILKDLSLSIQRDSITAVMGGNGAGKTTVLKALCGIIKPYSGKIFIDGRDIKKIKYDELFTNNLAMLPQDPKCLFVKNTVRDELSEMINSKDSDREEKLKHVSEICEISELLNSHPYDLSGGQQQRTALAKVLLTNPKILLLDEPTKGIDNIFKKKFADILYTLRESGTTIVIVSHDTEFCAKYCDNVAMLFDGKSVKAESVREFFSNNSFYTTSANRMSRHIFENAITDEDVIKLCKMKNQS